MINRESTPLSDEAAQIFTQAVVERLKQKDRIMMGSKHSQFSVKMQLVGHEILPHNPSELNIQIHLEILDLREEKPKVILQEILSLNAYVQDEIDINWKSPAFRMCPLGLAHRKLSREIATRIEDYILIAKKRTFE